MTTGRPQAVIFDWDNTLVDSWATIHKALNTTLVAMGHAPWSLQEVKSRVRLSLSNSFPLLFGTAWETAREIYLTTFERIHVTGLAPLPGVAAALDALTRCGCYVAIVSNKTGRLLRREVEALGWNGYFARIVGAGDAAADKPHRAPIDLALSGSGIEAGASVWYVGDTELDVHAARVAGCVAVLVQAGEAHSHGPGGSLTAQPDFVFDGFSSLLETFRSWES